MYLYNIHTIFTGYKFEVNTSILYMAARPVPERRSEPFALPTAHAQPQPRPFGRESPGSHPAPGLTEDGFRSLNKNRKNETYNFIDSFIFVAFW